MVQSTDKLKLIPFNLGKATAQIMDSATVHSLLSSNGFADGTTYTFKNYEGEISEICDKQTNTTKLLFDNFELIKGNEKVKLGKKINLFLQKLQLCSSRKVNNVETPFSSQNGDFIEFTVKVTQGDNFTYLTTYPTNVTKQTITRADFNLLPRTEIEANYNIVG